MNLEIENTLMEKIKSNESVHNIFKKSVANLHEVYEAGDMCFAEYQTEYNMLVYKTSVMAN